jgi:hypothetical protein
MYTKENKVEEFIERLLELSKKLNRCPSRREIDKDDLLPSSKTLNIYLKKYYGYHTFGDFCESYGFPKNEKNKNQYTKEEIHDLFEKFYEKNGRYPLKKECSNKNNLPSWETIERLFEGEMFEFKEIYKNHNISKVKMLGTNGKYFKNVNKEEIHNEYCKIFVDKCKELGRTLSFLELFGANKIIPDFPTSQWMFKQCKVNNYIEFLNYLGLEYFDKSCFGTTYIFEDGEKTRSKFEFWSSKFLKNISVKYIRDVMYKTFIIDYKGRKDCDYVIFINNKVWYVEIAGLAESTKSKIGIKYIKGIKEKEQMLKSANLNYKFIYPKDFYNHTIEEVFSFLFEQ